MKSHKKKNLNDERMDKDQDQEDDLSLLSNEIDKQSLKAAIWYTVAQIVQEEEIDLQRSVTEPFVASLTELVYAQTEHLALELKAFSTHAGRSTIREEDIKLMARKSNALQELLEEETQRYKNSNSTMMMAKTSTTTNNNSKTTNNVGSNKTKSIKNSKPKPIRTGGGPSSNSHKTTTTSTTTTTTN